MPAGWAALAVGVGTAAVSADSSRKAAHAQSDASKAALAAQQGQQNLTRQDTAQYRDAGSWALGQLTGNNPAPEQNAANFDTAAYLRANPDVAQAGVDPYQHYLQFGQREGRSYEWSQDAQKQLERSQGPQGVGLLNQPFGAEEALKEPGYQFGLQQGQLALDRKAAAAGGRVSGAALKAASEYGTNYATTGYNSAYTRHQDTLNRLAQLAGIGQSSTQLGAALGAGTANQNALILSSQGNAAGAAQLAQGNIWGNAANKLGAAGANWAQNPNRSWNQSPTTGTSTGMSGVDLVDQGSGVYF